MLRVLPIHFGVVLGCKGGEGKKQLVRLRTVSKPQYCNSGVSGGSMKVFSIRGTPRPWVFNMFPYVFIFKS